MLEAKRDARVEGGGGGGREIPANLKISSENCHL